MKNLNKVVKAVAVLAVLILSSTFVFAQSYAGRASATAATRARIVARSEIEKNEGIGIQNGSYFVSIYVHPNGSEVIISY